MSNMLEVSEPSLTGGILPFGYFWQFFIDGGWLMFVLATLVIIWSYWQLRLKRKFIASRKFVLLSIDVPREIEPNLKAIEQIYAQFSGVLAKSNFIEKYFQGKIQLSLSLELVSIGGYIQFLIRTPEKFRDLVESGFYAQYPDAVITEVEDYTKDAPDKFPNDKYDLYGSNVVFSKPNPFPIRTYVEFEHGLSQQLADPMAGLLEILSKLKQGEQIWIQLVIRPIDSTGWIKQGRSIINKMIGEKVTASPIFGPVGGVAHGTYETITASLIPLQEKKEERRQPKNWMMQLTPGEKAIVEAIQIKCAKKAYETKFRYIYLAEKPLVNKGTGVNAMFGAFNQFSTLNMNGFKPDKATFTKSNFIFFNKFRLARRQRRLMKNYKMRLAGKGIMMNIEELASVFHFPTLTVKAPLVKKIESKRGEPPVSLPIEEAVAPIRPVRPVAPTAVPPPGLPISPAPFRYGAGPAPERYGTSPPPATQPPFAQPPPTESSEPAPPAGSQPSTRAVPGKPPPNLPFA